MFEWKIRRKSRRIAAAPEKDHKVEVYFCHNSLPNSSLEPIETYSRVPNKRRLPNKHSHEKNSSKLINEAPKINLRLPKGRPNRNIAL